MLVHLEPHVNSDDCAMPQALLLPLPGSLLGSYLITRQAGVGAMAVVYEARHQRLGKRVAIKMLLPHFASDPNIAQRFKREGEAAARLDHPQAVDVTDVGVDAWGTPFLVMEFLDGEDLAALLARSGRLSAEQTADILVPVLSAVHAAHELGIIHRDLKPANIFLARRERRILPKVVDFGISKMEQEALALTDAETLLGTPYYMSPEQARGAKLADARSDQYAVGAIAYECLTGQVPFQSETIYGLLAAIVNDEPPPPSSLVGDLEPELERIVMRALSKRPEDRYPDARALALALQAHASLRVQLEHTDPAPAPLSSHGTAERASGVVPVPAREVEGRSHPAVLGKSTRSRTRKTRLLALLALLVLLGVLLTSWRRLGEPGEPAAASRSVAPSLPSSEPKQVLPLAPAVPAAVTKVESAAAAREPEQAPAPAAGQPNASSPGLSPEPGPSRLAGQLAPRKARRVQRAPAASTAAVPLPGPPAGAPRLGANGSPILR